MAEFINVEDLLLEKKSDKIDKIAKIKEMLSLKQWGDSQGILRKSSLEEETDPYIIFQIYCSKYFRNLNLICYYYEGTENLSIYILLNMLKYAMISESGKIFIFADETQRIAFECELNRSASVIKAQLKNLVDCGLFVHEFPATYYLNNEFWSHLQNIRSDINFNTCKLDVSLLDNERIQTLFYDKVVPPRLHKLFHILAEHMVKFTNKNMCDLVEHLINEEYIGMTYRGDCGWEICQGVYQHKTFRKIRFVYEVTKNEEGFRNLLHIMKVKKKVKYKDKSYTRYKRLNQLIRTNYFILITPESRKQLLKASGYKTTYFHADLSCLCSLGLLEKASAYRFFLNPEYIKPATAQETKQPCESSEFNNLT